MITLKRTFHPVGHGAFYTERFYEGDNCVYTAVYDCGSNTLSSNELSSLVTKEFPQGSKIDALFISHFDNDHVNGIQYLLNYCERIYVPALTPLEKITAFVYNSITGNVAANNVMQTIYTRHKEKVVEVEPFSTSDIRKERERKDASVHNGSLPAGMPIRANSARSYWIYLPFHLKTPINIPTPIKNTFADAINDNIVDFSKVAETIKAKGIPETKRLFDGIITVRKRNFYSMAVYSGYDKRACCSMCYCRCCCDECCCECNKFCKQNVLCKVKANCLYMGDFEARYKNVSDLTNFYKCYLFRSKTIQVPHHGSSSIGNQYNYDLYCHCNIGVISTANDGKVSTTTVVQQLLQRGVAPMLVDSNPLSKYVMQFNI